jgi:hypothetical protein
MNSLNNLFADCMNGFSLTDIPFFCVQIFSAACLALLIKLFFKRSGAKTQELKQLVVFTIIMTFITILAKNSITIGLIFIGAVILIRKEPVAEKQVGLPTYLATVAGVGVGSGNVVLTAVVLLISLVFTVFTPKDGGQD